MTAFREIHCLNRLLARMTAQSPTVGEALTRVLRQAEAAGHRVQPLAIRQLVHLYGTGMEVVHVDLRESGGPLWIQAAAQATLQQLRNDRPSLIVVTGMRVAIAGTEDARWTSRHEQAAAEARACFEDAAAARRHSHFLQLLFV